MRGFSRAARVARHQERRPGRAGLVQRPPRDRPARRGPRRTRCRSTASAARRLTLALLRARRPRDPRRPLVRLGGPHRRPRRRDAQRLRGRPDRDLTSDTARPTARQRRSTMPHGRTRPQVFPMSRADARLNNPTSRSVRLVTPESSGQERLYAGAFWSEPGADAGWAFVPDDPDMNSMAGGIPHLGDHDEVYLCLAGRSWPTGRATARAARSSSAPAMSSTGRPASRSATV